MESEGAFLGFAVALGRPKEQRLPLHQVDPIIGLP